MTTSCLPHYTPGLMSHAELEALFVQQEALAAQLVALTRENVLTPTKHSALLIGPRGVGKTHLIALLYHRLAAMADLHDTCALPGCARTSGGSPLCSSCSYGFALL